MSRLLCPGAVRSDNRILLAVNIPELFPLLFSVIAGPDGGPAALALKTDRFVDILDGLLYSGLERWRLVFSKDMTFVFEVPPEFSDAEILTKISSIKQNAIGS